MGAAGRCQVRSEGVTVPGSMPLTCRNVVQQQVCGVVRSVRIEGVRGSNPLSSTEFLQLSLRFNLRMISFWLVSWFSGQPGGLGVIVFSR
jgi:hypothetical protein